MWDFMCKYADMFNTYRDRVLDVVMAWAVTLAFVGSVLFIAFCICYIIYVKVRFYIEDLRKERGGSDV